MTKDYMRGGNMNLNENINDFSNSSSFVCFADYTNSSVNNYSTIYQIVSNYQIIERIPNLITEIAVAEARDHTDLKEFNNIEDFFDDLEK